MFERNEIGADTEGTRADIEDFVPIESTILCSGNNYDDIAVVKAQGFMIDDNNEPTPEHIPDGTMNESSTINVKLGWNGQCHWKLMGAHNIQQKLNIVSGIHLDVLGYVAMLLMFLPKLFV